MVLRSRYSSYLPLFLAALLPIVLFASVLAIIVGLRDQETQQAVAQSKVREMAGGIDRYIEAQLKAAEVLTQVLSLREGDLQRFYKLAKRVKDQEPAWDSVIILDPTGHELVDVSRPFGTMLPSAGDMPSFQQSLNLQIPVIGNLADEGSVSAKMFVPLTAPVIIDGKIKYILRVDLNPVELSKLFSLADEPSSWIGAIVDKNGRLLARSTHPEEYLGQLATQVAWDAIHRSNQGFYESRTREGLDTVFAFDTSPLTGWSVHYAVAKEIYRAPLARILWIILLSGLSALVLATGLFTMLNREASRQRALEKQEAETLERSEARLRSVFETSYQYQALLTPDGILMDANPTSLAGIKACLEEVLGKPFWATPWFTGTPGLPDMIKATIPLVAAGETVRREIEINLPDGKRAFDFSMRPVSNASGQIIGIVPEALEITERRDAESQLRQAQKMEAVGQLTGGIAHDFNNMLAIVIGSINLYKRRAARGETETGRFLDSALDAAQRAATLTKRLLAFSRQQPLSPQIVQANKLVAGITELLQRTLGEAVQLETVLAGGLWVTHADSSEIENALVNLAINGRDAMLDGGRLTIETSNAFLDEEYCARHRGITPGQYVLIAVTDTGTGMSDDTLQKAFDPFFTTKPVGQGTGLGLSQVFGFVRQSQGHLKIYSEVDVGTTVKIYLPRYHGTPEQTNAPRAAQAMPMGKAEEVILVAEDDEQLRHVTVAALQDLGYTVIEADGAHAALRALDAHAEIRLLFTDIVMPEMNGRKLAEEALKRRPDLKILYTTGYTKNAVVHNGILDAGVRLLVKPYGTDELARKIRDVLDSEPAVAGA